MIPTAQIAKPTVASMIGRFALLRGSHRAPGSGAPACGPAAGSFVARSLVLCVLVVLFALATAAVAQAEPPRLIQYGAFTTRLPVGVAVDNSSSALDPSKGDVYTAAYAASNINEFDASGSLVTPPSPFGEGNFSGAAVDPVNGDVYVITLVANEAGMVAVDTYDPNTGAPVGTPFEVPASKNFFGLTDVQIAADSAGNVYVPVVPENEVLEYSPTGTLLNTFTGGSGTGALQGPSGVAVDSAGNLWVADTGNNRLRGAQLGGRAARSDQKRRCAVAGAGRSRGCVRDREQRRGLLRLGA